MPRFFFFICNGHERIPDDEGSDLEDQTAARALAVDSVRSMVAEDARKGLIDLSGRIEVRDAANNQLLTVAYTDAFDLRIPDGPNRKVE